MDSGKKRKYENLNEEKVVLNVGGVKYETLRSTLTAYPDTLLGTMFQERNQMMLHPTNGNEYFFDRNSRAFYYIMEFYHTGKITWEPSNQHQHCDKKIICSTVNQKELNEELDYFQIPITNLKLHQVYVGLAKDVDELVDAVMDLVYKGMSMWEEYIIINVQKNENQVWFPSKCIRRNVKLTPVAFNILALLRDKVGVKLQASLPGLKYKYNTVPGPIHRLELTPSYDLTKFS